MDPLEIIAILGALIRIGGEVNTYIGKIKENLDKRTEMTAEETKAYDEVRNADYAKDYFQE